MRLSGGGEGEKAKAARSYGRGRVRLARAMGRLTPDADVRFPPCPPPYIRTGRRGSWACYDENVQRDPTPAFVEPFDDQSDFVLSGFSRSCDYLVKVC